MAPIPISSTLLSELNSQSAALVSSIASLAPRSSPPLQVRDNSALSSFATRNLPAKLLTLIRRQSNEPAIVPTTYGSINSGPSPGTIVGIILGSVGGFLILLWLIYTCMNFGTIGSDSSYTESVVVRERRKSHHGSTRSQRASETVEVRRERSPIRIMREPERVERIIVEERRETQRERSRGGSDEVVVIEDHHSPPRRKRNDKEERRQSGYRVVDPLAYGGAMGGRKAGSRRSSGR
jgi:hypothetical protein